MLNEYATKTGMAKSETIDLNIKLCNAHNKYYLPKDKKEAEVI